MISTFPLEILLNIIAHLSIHDIHSVQRLNRAYNELIVSNENTIYRAAAILHGFVSAEETGSFLDAESYHGHWLDGLGGWKDLCMRWFTLERRWEGHGAPPVERVLQLTGPHVHRFKLDEEHQFVITTHSFGGLSVVSWDGDTRLFHLSRRYVRRFAHCEYGNGYVVFDRLDPHSLEVWRLLSPDFDGTIPQPSPGTTRYYPHPSQIKVLSSENITLHPLGPDHIHGQFRPWALLTTPKQPRAYRFVYPTLLVGSQEGQEVYLFDIPTATLTQTINLTGFISSGNDQLQINYVELGQHHVFICTPEGVLIVSRDEATVSDGNGATRAGARETRLIRMFPPPGSSMDIRIPHLARASAFQMSSGHDLQYIRSPSSRRHRALDRVTIRPPDPATFNPNTTAIVPFEQEDPMFTAVHVNPASDTFITTTGFGVIYIVRNFPSVLRGEKSWEEATLRINLKTPALHLAYEEGRALIQTRTGIYIITLDTSAHRIFTSRVDTVSPDVEPLPVLPNLSMHKLRHFKNRAVLEHIECVQMTRTGAWLNWAPVALEGWTAGGHRRGQRTHGIPHLGMAAQFFADMQGIPAFHGVQLEEGDDGEVEENLDLVLGVDELDEFEEAEILNVNNEEAQDMLAHAVPIEALQSQRSVCCAEFWEG